MKIHLRKKDLEYINNPNTISYFLLKILNFSCYNNLSILFITRKLFGTA